MDEPVKTICRYYNTIGGCWYGDKCTFIHIPNKRPPCKYYVSSDGCRFGEGCHFSHDYLAMSNGSTDEVVSSGDSIKCAENSGSNNNNTNKELAETNGAIMALDDESLDVKANLEITETDLSCGLCHLKLRLDGASDSYCNLLKNHYLDCFLDKEGDHIKYVKMKAAIEPGQMYWCKQCMLVFEKPWSLFQHMADKAKGIKLARWDKKLHLEWLDNVAGLMAAYDLGLFSLTKLRIDLRNVLADQNAAEEESAALCSANANAFYLAMQNFMNPYNPMAQWRMQQCMNREMLRKLEQLSRGGSGASGNGNNAFLTPLNTSPRVRGRGRSRGVTNRQFSTSSDQSGPGGPMLLGMNSDLTSYSSELSNCGFTDAEVEMLLIQGFKPWDANAIDVLAVINGKYDYLLPKEFKTES